MTNIPTDLLRTLIAVVDLRSFTKAAAALGVTQPAVSAQIKRLQQMLGGELFDRSVQGISLTPHGDLVVTYARRLLSINDQIVHLGGDGPQPELMIRIGSPSDFVASMLPGILANFRQRWPDVRFIVRTDFYEPLVRDLRSGDLDVFVGLSMQPAPDARHGWPEPMVWVHGGAMEIDPARPVPLVSFGEPCMYHRLAVTALRAARRDWEDVFTGPNMSSLEGAVEAGLGVMAVTRRRANDVGLKIWEDAPLPALTDLYSGVFVREGGARAVYEQLADEIGAAIDPARGSMPPLKRESAA